MIKSNMFYGDPTIKDYREIDPREVIREFLLSKGTRQWNKITNEVEAVNHEIEPRELVSSGLFVYGLKDNPTNKRAIEYYCERWARQNQIMDVRFIRVPKDLWRECDEKNKEFTNGNDRKPKED